MTVIYVTDHDDYDKLAVRFQYDPSIIGILRTVPGAYWSPTDRAWLMPSAYDYVLESALAHWPVQWAPGTQPYRESRLPEPAVTSISWATALLAAVGPTRADAVFRALSKVLHPDVSTGDTELMRALIEARNSVAGGRAA